MPGLGDLLELSRPDLVQPDAGDEHRVLVEELIDLLEHPLGFDGDVVIVGFRSILARICEMSQFGWAAA